MAKKHPQWILAVDASYCRDVMMFKQGFNALAFEYFVDGFVKLGAPSGKTTDLASHLVLRERHHLEQDKDYLQILNYVVLKQSKMTQMSYESGVTWENLYSTYYRKKGVGEDRLADKMSIGWGGHSDRDMIEWDENHAVDFFASVKSNVIAELGQECRFRFTGTEYEYLVADLVEKDMAFKGFIYDMSDDVGQHHLGLVWELTVPDSVVIESREDEHKLGPMCNIHELNTQRRNRGDLYENWSNILIDALSDSHWEAWEELKPNNDWVATATNEAERQAEVGEPAIDFAPVKQETIEPSAGTEAVPVALSDLAAELGPRA